MPGDGLTTISGSGPEGVLEEATLDEFFSTPVVRYTWPDSDSLNQRLRGLILDEERRGGTPAHVYSNSGGWHSVGDLASRGWDELEVLYGRLRRLLAEATRRTVGLPDEQWRLLCTIQSWANINRPGDFNRPHVHRCAWSAVYYVAVGSSEREDRIGGSLELLDPRPGAAMVGLPGRYFGQRRFIRPEPGLMVLAPGWVTHLVNPFYGHGERISIAFTVTIEDVELPPEK
jgi:uncharacterized protein (TIGR02466 family)